MKYYIVIGCDLTQMSQETFEILTNKEAIDINQDPLGVQGKKISSEYGLEVWAGPLSDGSVAVALLNRSPYSSTISITWDMINLDTNIAKVRDLWQHEDVGEFIIGYATQVLSHDVAFLKVSPVA